MRRFGQVIRVRPEAIDEYERLHADPWPGVLAAIEAANIRNYSIYRHGELLFAYYEYVGDDLEADLSAMAADPIVQQWWTLTDAMQDPYPEREPGSWWLDLPEIFHTGAKRPARIAASSAPRMMPKSITDVTSISTLDFSAVACAGTVQ